MEAGLADSTGLDEGDNEDQVTALNFNEGRSDCLQCKEECSLLFASEASMKNSIALGVIFFQKISSFFVTYIERKKVSLSSDCFLGLLDFTHCYKEYFCSKMNILLKIHYTNM